MLGGTRHLGRPSTTTSPGTACPSTPRCPATRPVAASGPRARQPACLPLHSRCCPAAPEPWSLYPSLPGRSSAPPRAGTAGGLPAGCPAFLSLPCWHKDALLAPPRSPQNRGGLTLPVRSQRAHRGPLVRALAPCQDEGASAPGCWAPRATGDLRHSSSSDFCPPESPTACCGRAHRLSPRDGQRQIRRLHDLSAAPAPVCLSVHPSPSAPGCSAAVGAGLPPTSCPRSLASRDAFSL